MSAALWHFEPLKDELSSLVDLTDFEVLLVSKLVHVSQLGLHLHFKRGKGKDVLRIEPPPAPTVR